MKSNRLGCLTSTGIIAALITAFAIAGYAYARGGLMYTAGPLNAQSGEMLGGVTSHAAIGGKCEACHTCHAAPWDSALMADRCAACHTNIAAQMKDVASMHGTLLHDNPNLGCLGQSFGELWGYNNKAAKREEHDRQQPEAPTLPLAIHIEGNSLSG